MSLKTGAGGLMDVDQEGWHRLREHASSLPLLFSLRCTKP